MEAYVSRHLIKIRFIYLKRFNDQYHNEAVIGKIGLVGKEMGRPFWR